MLIEKKSVQEIYNKEGEIIGTFIPVDVKFKIIDENDNRVEIKELDKSNNKICFRKEKIEQLNSELTLFEAGAIIDLLSYVDQDELFLKFQGNDLTSGDLISILGISETRTRAILQKLEKNEILFVQKRKRKNL